MGRAIKLWRRYEDRVWGVLAFIGLLLLIAVVCGLVSGGCAFAPYPDGRGGGVLGLSIGADGKVETGGVLDSLGVILGVGAAVGVPGVGTLAFAVNRFMRAITDRAELRGREAGWDEREQAAMVTAPLPGPAANGGGIPGPVALGTHSQEVR